jgi:SAM-dependent methyltransferase
MSTLSQLAQNRKDLLELISKLPTSEFENAVNYKINLLNNIKDNGLLSKFHYEIDRSILFYKYITVSDSNIINDLRRLVDNISQDMYLIGRQIDSEFENKFNHISEFVRPNTYGTRLSPKVKEEVKVKINSFSSHLYPGLILGCKFKEWIDCMLASDPLYINNFAVHNLEEIIKDYPAEYQRRLRLYNIRGDDSHILPQNQFGIIVSWDYFPYIRQSDLIVYLIEMYDLLRPGGTFIFNYNNHYSVSVAKNIEQGIISSHCYSEIVETCNKLGFQIVSDNCGKNHSPEFDDVSWFELRKPGNLFTVKLAQVLGSINQK